MAFSTRQFVAPLALLCIIFTVAHSQPLSFCTGFVPQGTNATYDISWWYNKFRAAFPLHGFNILNPKFGFLMHPEAHLVYLIAAISGTGSYRFAAHYPLRAPA